MRFEVQSGPHSPSLRLAEPDLAAISASAGEPDPTGDPKEQLLKIPRPMGVYGATAIMLLLVLAQAYTIFHLATAGSGFETQNEPLTQSVLIGSAILEIFLLIVFGLGIWNGRPGARQFLILVVGIEILYAFLKWVARDQTIDTHTGVINVAIGVLLLVALTSTPVAQFAKARATWRKERKAFLKTQAAS